MLTVLMATHNGSDTLERTLQAFTRLVPPSGGWKLVIVDNASTDRTKEIIEQYRRVLPMDILHEPRPGKSFALNAGIERVGGDLVVFADDDVLPDETWLVEWRRVADRYPELGVFGGAIVPHYEAPPPAWLARTNWEVVLYTATWPDRPEGPMPAEAIEELDVFGPNMAVRSAILAEGLRFDERLMVGGSDLLGDETDLVERIVGRGHRAGFAATARVRHIVNPRQLARKWMLRRFYRHGRTIVFFGTDRGTYKYKTLGGVPRFLIRRLVERSVALPAVAARLDGFRLMSHLRLMAYDVGAARQAYAQARRRQPPRPVRSGGTRIPTRAGGR